MEEVEVRCPVGPQRLLSKLRLTGESPHYTDDNQVEFACQDCKRTLRLRGRQVSRVLHRYNFLGDLVQTVLE
jgi:hypothetical protein